MKISISIDEGVVPSRVVEIVERVADKLDNGFLCGLGHDHRWEATGGKDDDEQPPSLLEQGIETIEYPSVDMKE
jgi:hypothetical protein